jgi:hypothetical protein
MVKCLPHKNKALSSNPTTANPSLCMFLMIVLMVERL